jgi:penicillin-binding protein 1C
LLSVGGLCFLAFSKPIILEKTSFSMAVYDEHHRLLRLSLTPDQKYRLFVPLKSISPLLQQATILQEDKYFYDLPGVNFVALAKAAFKTYVMHHRQGASTITMQVARLAFHLNTHHLLGKIEQIIRALQIEWHYSKPQILEAYLNLAPYGNNIEGIGAASLIYYHQPAKQLSLPQALTLSVIPQNPNKRGINHLHYEALMKARHNLFQRWLVAHPQDKILAPQIELPLANYTISELPFFAPQFVNEVLHHNNRAHEITSTLDLTLQISIENTLKTYLKQKSPLGINNASILLIDTNTMAVKAMIGSGDFFNRKIDGQIDGTLANRSPGSTLKPFIYGLALEQGLIHPASILKDAKMSFGSYDPENFDYDFLGPISARDALILSRNIPAIYLASKLKKPTLYEFLRSANIPLKSESFYGLALVLGGAEITMQKLVSLYSIFPNGGIFHHLRFTDTQKLDSGKRLLSPEASFLVEDMLSHNPRPDQVDLRAALPHQTNIAWKTGTSSGYRDAWAVGTFHHYVLAVWIGNFDGSRNPSLIGGVVAAPLFFNIIDKIKNQLDRRDPEALDPSRLHLTKVAVCTASGMLPTSYCPNTKLTWFIPGVSPIKKDTVFREVMIDPKTGLRTCHFSPKNQFKIYEFWTSDLLALFKEGGIERRTPPPFDPKCNLNEININGLPPKITSPNPSLIYSISLKNPPLIIPLTAIGDADVTTFYWFSNKEILGKTSRDSPLLWQARPGQYQIRVVDNFGRANSVLLNVKVVN